MEVNKFIVSVIILLSLISSFGFTATKKKITTVKIVSLTAGTTVYTIIDTITKKTIGKIIHKKQ
jgi:hypothetical protein